jgi:hypothetical protein
MGYNSSDLLEEILHECYELGIINEVREEVIKTMNEKKHTRLVDTYQESFYKILNKKNKNEMSTRNKNR